VVIQKSHRKIFIRFTEENIPVKVTVDLTVFLAASYSRTRVNPAPRIDTHPYTNKSFMSGKPTDNAAKTILLKRKRAPVWPFTTRSVLEQAVATLVERGNVQELSPPDEWRIHPSTEA
jgi:hypothetical protein